MALDQLTLTVKLGMNYLNFILLTEFLIRGILQPVMFCHLTCKTVLKADLINTDLMKILCMILCQNSRNVKPK